MSMPDAARTRALEPIRPDADQSRLAELEARLSLRERELDTLKVELQQLQDRYLSEIGALYRELAELEQEAFDAEVRAGLRPPPEDSDPLDPDVDDGVTADDEGCSAPAPATDLLKQVFRDLARSIHPDLAGDDATRLRRHSLMAEANRAYAERDHDRLLLILRRWETNPDSVPADDPDAERLRRLRRAAAVEEQLAAIDRELIDVRNSGISRLAHKINETRRQGWDLFAEMVLQVKADIARARARLNAVRRMTGIKSDVGSQKFEVRRKVER